MSGRVVLTEEERKARRRESSRRWREVNPEKAKEAKHRYREANRAEPRIALSEQERKARRREYNRRYYEANREISSERNRQYYEVNKEKIREQQRQYYTENKEDSYSRLVRWRNDNRETVRMHNRNSYKNNTLNYKKNRQKWDKANPEKRRGYRREWAIRFPEKEQERNRSSGQARRARKVGAIDPCQPVTAASIARRTWLFGNCCAYCGNDGPLHLDHVEPLARGGMHTPDNLVPACQRCNLSKLAKPVESWYMSQPFFSPERWEALQAHTGRRRSATEQLSLMDLLPA
jgi:5-methylcytosine-specific restriction endonuclease McrA